MGSQFSLCHFLTLQKNFSCFIPLFPFSLGLHHHQLSDYKHLRTWIHVALKLGCGCGCELNVIQLHWTETADKSQWLAKKLQAQRGTINQGLVGPIGAPCYSLILTTPERRGEKPRPSQNSQTFYLPGCLLPATPREPSGFLDGACSLNQLLLLQS